MTLSSVRRHLAAHQRYMYFVPHNGRYLVELPHTPLLEVRGADAEASHGPNVPRPGARSSMSLGLGRETPNCRGASEATSAVELQVAIRYNTGLDLVPRRTQLRHRISSGTRRIDMRPGPARL